MSKRHHFMIVFPTVILLLLLSQKNFLLFHAVVEFGSMGIFLFAVFLGFFATRLVNSPFLYGLSVTYFCVSIINFLHALSYHGMGVFPLWTANQPTQLWILSRYIHSAGILLTILLAEKKGFRRLFPVILALFFLSGIALIFLGLFPVCFDEATGLTPFKIASEYITAVLFGLSIYLFMKRPQTRRLNTNDAFARSLLYFLVAGLAFTLYADVYGISNMIGHIFYFLGAYILLTGFIIPYSKELLDAHFFALNSKIRRLNRNLEERVRRRTEELEKAMKQLEEDVAKREIVEEGMRRAKIETEMALRARNEFIATMSHEVRTPLSGILGVAEYISEMQLPISEMKKYISLIKSSGESLLETLNNILDLSKVEAGRQKLEIVPFSPLRLAESVTALFSVRADAKDITLTYSVDPDLPPVLLGDALLLRQVFFNLVNNGVKFTEKGEVTLELKLTGREGERVHLTAVVKDTGIGISDEEGKKLFEPFTQLDGTITRRFGGTGLGLVISKKFVELMGGTLDFDSRPGEGTAFFFTLVCTEGREGEIAGGQKEKIDLPEELSILLAEDNPINSMVIENYLKRDGWTVTAAENGAEAIERAKDGNFDLYILDIQMPEVDGYQAAREIRALGRERGTNPPIIALTAYSTVEFRSRAEKAGIDIYLTKPVKKVDLLKTIARAMNLDSEKDQSVPSPLEEGEDAQ